MARIRKLPPEVVHRIAAGEVIERPSSVVKELVENSIDAEATEVRVDLEDGGRRRITVADNGAGMEPEDLPLAFESHATSKLDEESCADGLFGILTLGFRGEALPSIASVAEVEVLSRRPLSEHGFRYRPGSGRGMPEPAAAEPGTVVEVRDLFHRVPARRKFLKGAAAESSQVVTQVTRIALAYPGVRFQVTSGKKRLLELAPADSLRERVLQLVDRRHAPELIEARVRVESPGEARSAAELSGVESGRRRERGPLLHGFVGKPTWRRGDSRLQSFFVNGRWVRDRALSAALRAGYQGFLIPGCQPVAWIFLDFPADAVDVNVHPTKCEVRFRDAARVFPMVRDLVRRALGAEDLEPRECAQAEPSREEASPRQAVIELREGSRGASRSSRSRSAGPLPVSRLFREERAAGTRKHEPLPEPRRHASPGRLSRFRGGEVPVGDAVGLRGESSRGAMTGVEEADADGLGAPMQVVPDRRQAPPSPFEARRPRRAFQVLDTFILFEDAGGLRLVDQHALHEKVLFEEIEAQLFAGEWVQQRLIVPEVISVEPEHVPLLETACAWLARCGYDASVFGDCEIAIHAVPELLRSRARDASAREPVLAVLDWIAENEEAAAVDLAGAKELPEPLRRRLRDLASLIACKRAVKAGQPLAPADLDFLLQRAELAEDPRHCPHGRPTSAMLSRRDLERLFDRR